MFNLTRDEGNGNRRTVDARLIETFQDRFVELRICSTGKETVKFYEKKEINVFGGRGLAVLFADMMTLGKIDTLAG